jgi:hypothetical protein
VGVLNLSRSCLVLGVHFTIIGSAVAQNFPSEVKEAAEKFAAACADSNSSTLREMISVQQSPGGHLVYVVDGAATPCEDEAIGICGTGGCQTKIIQYTNDTVKVLYDDHAWSWKTSNDGTEIVLTSHPTFCGGPDKANSCEVHVDLNNGHTTVRAVQ